MPKSNLIPPKELVIKRTKIIAFVGTLLSILVYMAKPWMGISMLLVIWGVCWYYGIMQKGKVTTAGTRKMYQVLGSIILICALGIIYLEGYDTMAVLFMIQGIVLIHEGFKRT